MQIARVVPKVLTQKESFFDYSIPPEILPFIKPYILVEVPFHGRRLEGIVIDLKKKSNLKDPHKLKPILKIIDPNSVIDSIHLELSKWMASYYFSNLSKTLFENVVPSARKLIKKNTPFKSPLLSHTQTRTLKYLVMGNFKDRINFYQEAIKKTLKQNKSVIFLVPDLSQIKYLPLEKIKKYPGFLGLSLIHSQSTHSERFLAFDNIRRGKSNVIIGSISSLFTPVSNLGLIIIDQEENETYKNDRSPRFHCKEVAQKLAELSGANLILGSLTPRIETYYEALQNKYRLKKIISREKVPDITIVDLKNKYQTISLPLRDKIEFILSQRKKIILVLNRKGEGTRFTCPDCQWTFDCPKCGLPLIPQSKIGKCFHCQISEPLPERCPKCQSVKVFSLGLGTAKLAKFVQDFWPNTKILRLEESTMVSKDALKQPWEIAIVTSYGLKFNFPNVGLVAIIDADQILNLPDFHAHEKAFQTFYKFLKIGEQGIIQTKIPDSTIFAALARLDFEKFFLDELANRKKFTFPPFSRLTRLLYLNSDEDKCRLESQKLYTTLNNFKNQFKLSKITIFEPDMAFISRRLLKYRMAILIKITKKLDKSEIQKLTEIIQSLPKGWIVDVDPINLL